MLLLGNEMIDVWACAAKPLFFMTQPFECWFYMIPSHLILVEMGKTQCHKSLNVPGLPKARLNLAVPQTAGRYLKTVENSWYLFISVYSGYVYLGNLGIYVDTYKGKPTKPRQNPHILHSLSNNSCSSTNSSL